MGQWGTDFGAARHEPATEGRDISFFQLDRHRFLLHTVWPLQDRVRHTRMTLPTHVSRLVHLGRQRRSQAIAGPLPPRALRRICSRSSHAYRSAGTSASACVRSAACASASPICAPSRRADCSRSPAAKPKSPIASASRTPRLRARRRNRARRPEIEPPIGQRDLGLRLTLDLPN